MIKSNVFRLFMFTMFFGFGLTKVVDATKYIWITDMVGLRSFIWAGLKMSTGAIWLYVGLVMIKPSLFERV